MPRCCCCCCCHALHRPVINLTLQGGCRSIRLYDLKPIYFEPRCKPYCTDYYWVRANGRCDCNPIHWRHAVGSYTLRALVHV